MELETLQDSGSSSPAQARAVSRFLYWLGPAIIAMVIAGIQAEWLNRNFPNYPPLRFDSAAYFARCLDNFRALEIAGWPAIGNFQRRACTS